MFSSLEWGIALRYLRSRREGFISLIAWLSLIGIALGVATLIIVLSVMNGFRAELLDRILGVRGHIVVEANVGTISEYDSLTNKLASLDGVLRASPIIEGQVMVLSGGIARGANIRGVTAKDLSNNPLITQSLIEGGMESFAKNGGLVIGSRLASIFDLQIGDKLTLVAPNLNTTPFGAVPRLKSWHIEAIFQIGMYEYDIGLIYAPLDDIQNLFKIPNGVTSIELFINNPESPDQISSTITEAFGDIKVFDWRDVNIQFFNALEIERNVMFVILTMIILVATLNVISGLVMMVKDKRGDIAILRTIGSSRGMILRIFFLSGASVGLIGTISGLIIGLAFTKNIESIRQFIQYILGTDLFAAEIYFLSTLPAKVSIIDIVTVVSVSLILSFTATLYPAWRAAQTDPVKVLRSE